MPTIPIAMDLTTRAAQTILIGSQVHFALWLRTHLLRRGVRAAWLWALLFGAAALSMTLYSSMFLLDVALFGAAREFDLWRLGAACWTAGSFGAYGLILAWKLARWAFEGRPDPEASQAAEAVIHPPTRREALAASAAPFGAAAYGVFIGRKDFELREVDVRIRNLPADLEGVRIAQLTDIHCGIDLPPRMVERAVSMANETRPHLAVVTGDLVTAKGDPIADCLDALAGLRSDAGVLGCLGNHEEYAECERLAVEYGAGKGLRFLRHQAETLRFGEAYLNVAGVDYQRTKRPYLQGAEQLVLRQGVNVLLSHNPDVLPKAAELGYDLVISGHTHGGQVTLEIVEQTVNAGRFFTPYVVGEYHHGDSSLYVSRGVGTVNLPMRIGALPEITLLRLRRA